MDSAPKTTIKKRLKQLARFFVSGFIFILVHPTKKDIIGRPRWLIRCAKTVSFFAFLFPINDYFLYGHMLHFVKEKFYKHLEGNETSADLINKYRFYFNGCDDKNKFWLTKAFFLLNIMDPELSRDIVAFSRNTKNKQYRYWTTMDISKFTFASQKGFYKDFYTERRQLLAQISEENGFHMTVGDEKSDALVIVCYLMEGGLKNSSFRVCNMVANGLSRYYERIDIVTLDVFAMSFKERFRMATVFPRKKTVNAEKYARAYFDNNVHIHSVNGHDFEQKSQRLLDLIGSLKPSAILDMSDEYSAISYVYSKYIPTFYQPLRNNASSSFYSFILGMPEKFFAGNSQYNSVEESKIIDFRFPEYVPSNKKRLTRNSHNFSDSDFIILSIGNNSNAFCDRYVDEMASLLNKYKHIKWVFVGDNCPQYLSLKYNKLISEGRVINWGYESNLLGLCGISDILLRGENSGGSGATAIAAMQQLPIVMPDYVCDAMRWLGMDYSNIHEYSEIVEEIEKLLTDREYYLKRGQLAYSKVLNATNSEQKWRELSEIIKSRTIKKR